MNNKEKVNAGEKIGDFIQARRKVFLVFLGVFVFAFLGMVAYLLVSDNLNSKDNAAVEELTRRFSEVKIHINPEQSSEDVDVLLADLETFTDKKSLFFSGKTFARGKAWSLIGQIHSGREDWPHAQFAWENAAKYGVKTYLGPIALFEAAVAAEEQGDIERAIELLQQCVDHKFEFPSAPRAQFSIGRLNEQLGNKEEALEAYRTVLINWPEMPVFHNLARTRIISIEE